MALFTYCCLSQGCPLTINMWGLRSLLSYSGLASLSVYILVTLALFKRPVWHCGLFLPGLSGVCTLDAIQVMWS